MISASIGKVIAGDGGNDHVSKSHAFGSLGQSLRFVIAQWRRFSAFYRTESTGPGADAAQYHESGCFLGIAFHAIGAFGMVTNGLQLEFFQ